MKKVFLFTITLAAAGLIYAFMPKGASADKNMATPKSAEGAIKWMSWEDAVKANEKAKKIFFIDFYTDWCGWCKKMDATTFSDPAVAAYVNENFYPVKFNAEQKEEVVFNGQTFKWQAGGRGGVHMLAYSLLDGRLGYPSYVYLTPTYERILISPGFKPAPDLQKELKFVKEGHYNNTSWEQYRNSN
jgi:thioredoxin-related protein